MFQVVVLTVCGIAAVLMRCSPFHLLRCVTTIFVATHIRPKKLDHSNSSRSQQVLQFLQSCSAKVAELFAVHLLNGFVETGQKLQSLRVDSSRNHATVLRFPKARDQFSLLQTVE